MLREELIELTKLVCSQKAEEQTVEVKAAHEDCPKKLYGTLSSFSNQDMGGIILFGIDESADFQVVGVSNLQLLQKKVTEQCLQMEPPVRALFTFAEYEGKQICSAEIPALDISERPCYYRGIGKTRGSFVRVGEADLPMTEMEIYSFEAYRKHIHDDVCPVSRVQENLMNHDSLDLYVAKMKLNRPGFSQLSKEQTYEMLDIYRDGAFTLAAVENFCLCPQGFLPQLAITAVVVPGIEVGEVDHDNARFLDNKQIEGTIPQMVEDALRFCMKNMKTRTIIEPSTGLRKDREEYPVDALREAILNALIHRDYSIFSQGIPVSLTFFSNRVEIRSPGSLYGGMRIEDLGVKKPELRNPSLFSMTRDLTNAENRFSGIPTMRRKMKEFGLPEPKFENRRDEFVVTFFNSNANYNVKKNESYANLYEFCETPRTRKEIADFVGVNTVFYAMNKFVDPMIKEGKLKMTLPEKPQSSKQKFVSVH